MPYDLKSVTAQRLAGLPLRVAAALFDNPVTSLVLGPRLMSQTGVVAWRQQTLEEAPSVTPPLPRPGQPAAPAPAVDLQLQERLAAASQPRGFAFESVAELARAFREHRATPTQVAERALAAARLHDERTPRMRSLVAFREDEVLRQARESTLRLERGEGRGPLEGVPVAVKDELDVAGYPTTVGTRFLGREPAAADATVVARLRAAGAVILGKANMFEIGIDTTGHNPHHGTPRNPYGVERYPGGSSSGSAAAVAQGLCPLALGADGGGSIRIPAALCGVVGLKPTFGRVSEHGAAPLCWSVAHVGPIGATVSDVAAGYAAIAGADPRDPNSLLQPPPVLGALEDLDLRGVRLGVFTPWLEHADPEVVACVRRTLEALAAAGATLVEVDLPDLEHARLSHAVTILTEMATAMDPHLREHRTDFGLSVRLNLAMARALTSRDYVRAQQGRTRATRSFERVLSAVDAVVTPTTACTAPALRPDAVARGESDLDVTSRLMRFVFPSNLTGHPALSVSCGYDAQGLPVGLQFIGRAWDELTLLRLGLQVERHTERREPLVHARLLPR